MLATKIWVFEGGGRDQGDPNFCLTLPPIHCRLSLRNMHKLRVGGVQLEYFTCNVSNLFSRKKKKKDLSIPSQGTVPLFCFAFFFSSCRSSQYASQCVKHKKSASLQLSGKHFSISLHPIKQEFAATYFQGLQFQSKSSFFTPAKFFLLQNTHLIQVYFPAPLSFREWAKFCSSL